MKQNKLTSIKGTFDLFGMDAKKHQKIFDVCKNVAKTFGFNNHETPIFESTDVFKRPLGDTSDVVTKEMYTFESKSNKSITLRPEGTAGFIRSFIQNNLHVNLPYRGYYFGPMFRYERPQKGRQRQFHQFGVELMGDESYIADLDVIFCAVEILKKLNIYDDCILHINSVGDKESTNNYKQKFVEFITKHKQHLSDDSKNRLEKNPLRILDSKDKGDIEILKDAPKFYDYLNDDSKQRFDKILAQLDMHNVKYVLNHKLVRGFDYYNHIVFEFITDKLGSQGTVIGGGRYDGFVETMGGNPCVGVGFGCGIERIALMLGDVVEKNKMVTVINFDENGETKKIEISSILRKNNFIVNNLNKGNFKKKIEYANKIGANFAIIIGDKEIQNEMVTIKNLINGEQITVKQNDILNNLN